MTREDIDEALALIVAGKRTWTSGDPVESLAEIVADQERRLRALEDADGLDCGPESDADGNMRRRR